MVEEEAAKAARPEVKLQLFDEDGAKSSKLKAQKAKDAALALLLVVCDQLLSL